MVPAARRPVGGLNDATVGCDHPGIAERELCFADLAEEPLELAGVPAIVLVAEGDEVRLRRRHRQGPLEVAVEAEPPPAGEREALVSRDLRSSASSLCGREPSSLITHTQLP